MRHVFLAVALFFYGVAAGMQAESWWNGKASIYHNVDEGTAINHGQPSVEVNFHGRLPDNGGDWIANPHWRQADDGSLYFESFSLDQGVANSSSTRYRIFQTPVK